MRFASVWIVKQVFMVASLPPLVLADPFLTTFLAKSVTPDPGSRESGILSQPIKFQVRIYNRFSDSLFGINLVHSASSAAAPDVIHMDTASRRRRRVGPSGTPMRCATNLRTTSQSLRGTAMAPPAPCRGCGAAPPPSAHLTGLARFSHQKTSSTSTTI